MAPQPLAPTITTHLFAGMSQALLSLLRSVPAHDFDRPTACPGWSVKDLVAHLLGGNLGRLSFQRDQLARRDSAAPASVAELVDWINQQNDAWVRSSRHISAPVLLDFLELTDGQLQLFFETLPPESQAAISVAWAGEATSTNWMDIGREYTEKWFHQQHIREALGIPGLLEDRWVRPVIEIGLRALPYTYRAVAAEEGACISIALRGAGGGAWSLLRQNQHWLLTSSPQPVAQTQIELSTDTAWRLFSKGLTPQALRQAVTITGDAALGTPLLDLVAIMA